MKILIVRTAENQHQTIGTGLVLDDNGVLLFQFATLELPFLGNRRLISCIPLGVYKIVKRRSERFGTHFHVLDVTNRTLILIHVGNYHRNSSGCILVGREHKHLDTDSCIDVADSRNTMNRLLALCSSELTLEILESRNKSKK